MTNYEMRDAIAKALYEDDTKDLVNRVRWGKHEQEDPEEHAMYLRNADAVIRVLVRNGVAMTPWRSAVEIAPPILSRLP